MEEIVNSQSSVLDQIIRIGLIFGAIFQLICIAAVIVFPSSDYENGDSGDSASSDDDTLSIESTSGLSVTRVWSSGHGKKTRSEKKKRR